MTTPSEGARVVNGYGATLGLAEDNARNKDDLPAFGAPSKPQSAMSLSDNRSRRT